MKKKVFYSELAYVFGVVILAAGTALMERGNLGMSMVTAPAYIIHLKVSQRFPWYTFGTSTYLFQCVLLVILALILRHFKKGYLFSFATAVFFGLVLDFILIRTGRLPDDRIIFRIIYYCLGMIVCALGVSLVFHTYIAPEVYELFVKETAVRFGWNMGNVKTVYDCCSLLLGIILSFAFFGFGHFEGVKLGTIFCALVNGQIIRIISSFLESRYTFADGLPLRKYFDR